MKYKIWDTVSYGEMEPLTPFTMLFESNNINEIKNYIDEYENSTILIVTMNDEILFNTLEKIYESDGKNIFERKIISNKKDKIKIN